MDASLLVSQIRLVIANFSCLNFFVIIFLSYHIRRWESAMTHIFVWLLLHSFGLQMDLMWEWPQLQKLIILAASTFRNVRLFSINILSFLLIFDLVHILRIPTDISFLLSFCLSLIIATILILVFRIKPPFVVPLNS